MRKTELQMKNSGDVMDHEDSSTCYAGWKMHKTMLHIKKYESDSSELI